MTGAIVTAKLSKEFVGGYEFELLLISICLTLVFLVLEKYRSKNLLKKEIFPKGKQLYRKLQIKKVDRCYNIYVNFITYLFILK